jgi:CRP-like cAMP-binding protein
VNDHYSKNNPITSNRLLGGIPANEFERFASRLETVELKFGSSIYELNATINHVYFPNSGIISLLAAAEESATLEVGVVGMEGMAGLPLFLGVKRSRTKAIVQGKGTAMRMKAADLERECSNGGSLSMTLRRFTHSMITQISQSAVCFRFHVIEMRLARWLLMTSDRTESNEFPMTQEFLSHMLGVRREAVNRAALSLQRRSLIAHGRSNILIIDRPGLEAAACKCYSIIRDEEKSDPVKMA